ncbi:glycosyltransferase, partial [Patescibacteria group bacterium]|nr:glycosyltransferase [Patescibacteria group bacterium]
EESEKFKILQSMNFFVFPSTAEGFGYTPIEAVYSKILVISSDITVLKNVLGDSVVYFKSQNTPDLFKKLEDVLSLNEIAVKTKIDSGVNLLMKYSMESFYENYAKIYEQK